MNLRFEFSFLQRQSLRKWFDSMDADGSGDISINELTDALLSTGAACDRSTNNRATRRSRETAPGAHVGHAHEGGWGDLRV
jgi:Ca2+-binding EF-hand superfamily protein